MKAGNGGKAFAHAAPGIRQQFGTAGNFLAMVRTAYGALIAARYTEFLEGAVIEGRVIQPLRLVGSDNSVRVALYTMEKQPDGAGRSPVAFWRHRRSRPRKNRALDSTVS